MSRSETKDLAEQVDIFLKQELGIELILEAYIQPANISSITGTLESLHNVAKNFHESNASMEHDIEYPSKRKIGTKHLTLVLNIYTKVSLHWLKFFEMYVILLLSFETWMRSAQEIYPYMVQLFLAN